MLLGTASLEADMLLSLFLSAVAAWSTLKETHCDKWSAGVLVMEGRWGRGVVLPGSPLILLG